jgi:16S rRNA processing protein RimM
VEEPTIAVGYVTRAHGIRGEVAVEDRSDNPQRWTTDAVVFDDTGRPLTVRAVRPHGGRLLVTFDEITDRTSAQTLAGRTLMIPESWLPPLADGQWWSFQVEGCVVTTESGRSLGSVREVLAYPAHDLWRVVDDDGSDTLIPAVDAFVVSVDVDARTATVRDVPGLTAPDPDER